MQEISSPDVFLRTWDEGPLQHVPLNTVMKKRRGKETYHFIFTINLDDQFGIKDHEVPQHKLRSNLNF